MTKSLYVHQNWEPLVGYTDWRGGEVYKAEHGGRRSTYTVYAMEIFETMAFTSVAGNLVKYLTDTHYSTGESATITTNFLGASFLLAVVGGFISDSYITRLWMLLIFAVLELLGDVLLTLHVHFKRKLEPESCIDDPQDPASMCGKPQGMDSFILFAAIYIIALGNGGLRSTLASQGGDQFDEADSREKRQLSSFFNWFYFSTSAGTLLGLTFGVWVQANVGYEWGYALSAACMLFVLLSFGIGVTMFRVRKLQGSPLTRIAQVFVAAYNKRNLHLPSESALLYELSDKETDRKGYVKLRHTHHFRFLDKAAMEDKSSVAADLNDSSPWYLCSLTQVEEAKLVLRLLPIFACNIVPACILAQVQTMAVRQASTINTRIPFTSIVIPPASIIAIPAALLLFLVPFYDCFVVPSARIFFRRLNMMPSTKGGNGAFPPLQRIGAGLFFSAIAPTLAGVFEIQRKAYPNPPINVVWMIPLYFAFALVYLFSFVGLLEFFYTQAPHTLRSLSTSLTFVAISFGYFLSTLLVLAINKVTTPYGSWLGSYNLDNDKLEYFYWLLAALSILNFFLYLYCARWYTYKQLDFASSSGASTSNEASFEMPSSRFPMLYHSRSSSETTINFEDQAAVSPYYLS